jgi:hypothetical protein
VLEKPTFLPPFFGSLLGEGYDPKILSRLIRDGQNNILELKP